MAHSFVTFEEKDIRVHDLDLAIACVLIVDAAKRSDPNPRVAAMLAGWMDSISSTGPGCIDLNLDEHLAVKEDREQLISILDKVRGSLSNTSDLPASRLNALLLETKIVLKSHYPTDPIIGALDAIRTALT